MDASVNETVSKNSGFFYGWWIVGVSTLLLMITNGLSIGGLPIFYEKVGSDFIERGILTKETVAAMYGTAPAITFLIAGLLSPFVGALIKRVRMRILMTIGCAFIGCALILYANATTPLHVYLAHAGLGFGLAFAGLLVNTVLLSNWFRRQRGKALGIAITGTSFGGVLIPTLAAPLIGSVGWRTTMLILSSLVWVVLIPAVWLLVRVSPDKMGMQPDGEAADPIKELAVNNPETPTAPPPLTGMTFGEALRTPMFWVLGLCAALIFYPIFTTSQQFILYLQRDLQFSTTTAALAQAFMFVTSVGGKFGFGWLADKISISRVLLLCCGLMFLGTLFLLNLNATTAFLFLIPFGLGYGGTFVLIQLMTAESFGLRDIGKILGVIIVIETIGGAVGSIITGQAARAAGGNYAVAFNGVIIATGLALLMSFFVNLLAQRKAKTI